jgi:hypothetical protein
MSAIEFLLNDSPFYDPVLFKNFARE